MSEDFTGTWHILETEVWGTDDLDLLGPPEIRFGPDDLGSFQFLALEGDIDFRIVQRDGESVVEFSWQGFDDSEPTGGRGFARIEGGELKGRIWIHRGDDSAFRARRSSSAAADSR